MSTEISSGIQARLNDLEKRNEAAMAGGGAARIAKHKQGGRLSARERVDVLLDPGSFVEMDRFVIHHNTNFGMAKNVVPGDGVITGYGVRLSEAYENALVRAHVLITLAPKMLGRVTQDLEAIPHVRSVYSVSGSFDMIAIVAARSISELDATIDNIGSIDGVEKTLSSIILSTRIAR